MSDSSIPPSVVHAFGFEGSTFEPITVGLLNRTFAVTTASGTKRILQRLHPIFRAEVNTDIDVITARLADVGRPTPRLVRTRDGSRFVEDDGIWRVLTFLEGRVVDRVDTPEVAWAAGALAGEFHRALADFEHTFAFTRPGAHDTSAHLAKLARVFEAHGAEPPNPLRARLAPLAASVLELGRTLGPIPSTRPRIIHGDLKITNLIFEADSGAGLALLDLDTMAMSSYPIELGDALRSWSNPAGESSPDAHCELALAESALVGWTSVMGAHVDRAERDAIPRALAIIANELAARFAVDVLEDSYFGWDASRFASRAEHNLARASSQHALARDAFRKIGALERLLRTARVSAGG